MFLWRQNACLLLDVLYTPVELCAKHKKHLSVFLVRFLTKFYLQNVRVQCTKMRKEKKTNENLTKIIIHNDIYWKLNWVDVVDTSLCGNYTSTCAHASTK